ncbi:MAG: recombinase family protein [Burkholderiales bacterium]
MYQMLGVFAEYERAMIQERVKPGLAKAKAQGKQLGPSLSCEGTGDSDGGARRVRASGSLRHRSWRIGR